MKVIYPFNGTLKFGNEELENFITINDKVGKYVPKLKYKRIFYILQFNGLEPDIKTLRNNKKIITDEQFKIGIAHTPASRLKSYYNSFGSNHDKNKHCSGVKVLFLCGTTKIRDDDYYIKRGTYEIERLEKKMKKHLKDKNYVERGTEFIKCPKEFLLKTLQKFYPTIQPPIKLKRLEKLRPLKK